MTLVRTGFPVAAARSPAPTRSCRLCKAGAAAASAEARSSAPRPGVGAVWVVFQRGRSFLSTGPHGQSRRFSVLVTFFYGPLPNGVARDRRGTSCGPPHPPPLPGGARRAPRRPRPGRAFCLRFRVVPRRGRPFLSHGAVGPSRGLCASLTLRLPPSAGRGGRGRPRGSPGGAPLALNGR